MTQSSLTVQASDLPARMELFAAVCDETVTVSQFQAFENLLRDDEQARDEFSQFVQMQVLLQRKFAVGQFPADIPDPATVVSSPSTGFLAAPLRGAFDYFSQEVPLSYSIGTVLTALLLLIASLVQVSNEQVQIAKRSPSLPTAIAASQVNAVGRITDLFHCQGEKKAAKSGQTLQIHGSRLQKTVSLVALGDKFSLASGLLEITYDSGARVILQGPVTYEINSHDGGFLSCGKLTARLEKKGSGVRGQGSEKVTSGQPLVVSGQWSVASEANPKSQITKSQISNPLPSPAPRRQSPAPVFAVRTPTATVTDLGTEFGVEVNKAGSTTSHVFRGSVRVQLTSDQGVPTGDGQVLHENQSARIERKNPEQRDVGRIVVLNAPAKAGDFVRRIPRQETAKPIIKTFDLVDVVAGGNGFSGQRGAGIDPTTGRRTKTVEMGDPNTVAFPGGDHKYHRVEELPFVDGVFVPDGSVGPVQVDSAGHLFADCPKTTNIVANHVWAGGPIPAVYHPIRTVLGGVDYASKKHGLLFMHSNKGITFDLDAIRKANPNCTIKRFLATAGNTETGNEEGQQVYADFWVLVDGQIRFRRWQVNAYNNDFPIAIPIGANDHFLTLASTDGGNGIGWDWIIFGDPRLELVMVANQQDAKP